MAGTSDNYNLTLPELEDKIMDSIPQIAENFKTIDKTMKANEEKINTDIAEAIDNVEAQLSETNKDVDTLDKALTSTKAEWTELFDGAVKAVFGYYYGTNREATVKLGFTPVAVLVLGGGTTLKNSATYEGGLVLQGHPLGTTAGRILEIVENGFKISNSGDSGTAKGRNNYFIAFKTGEIMKGTVS